MPLLLVSSKRFEDHVTPPGHPERPARAETMEIVATRWRQEPGIVAEPRPATRADLTRVHAGPYLDAIAATAGRAVALDADTYTSPQSHDVALLAAGAAIAAVDHVIEERGSAFALVRPPGHHAEASRAMGFCLYNNVAVASAYALTRGIQRVALVDFDVHHGNGSQWMFYDDPRVLYISTHQYPFYPGTGAADDVGRDKGRGFTVNVPLAAGCADCDYDYVFRTVVVPVLEAFAPELILMSAGFDAHERDPLAGMRVTAGGFAAMVARLRRVADRCCGGRLAAVTEGGYDLEALAASLKAVIEVIEAPRVDVPPEGEPSDRARSAVQVVKRAQARYWPEL